MKNILRYIFKPSELDKQAAMMATSNTIHVTHAVLMVAMAVDIVMLILNFTYHKMFLNTLYYHRACYLILGISGAIWMMGTRYVMGDYDARFRLQNALNTILIAAMYAFAFLLFYINSKFNGIVDVAPFMMISFVIPMGIYVKPVNYIVVALSFNIAVIVRLYILNTTWQTVETDVAYTNFFIFALLQIVSGVGILYTKHSLQKEILAEVRQNKEIEMLSRSQNRFFSNMSHEIRTPINTIIGLNEMTLRENVSPEITENSENIRVAGNMLLHLINDILDMSKIESGQMEINPAPYKSSDMISDIVGMFWYQAKEKELDFKVSIAPDFPADLLGDDVRIKQVLVNVLNNAIKYTRKGSVSLSIQCERMDEDMAKIIYTVADTGAGIKKENIPHLFTAFKREDEDRNRYIEGTGLGLSIVKQFVDMMGGNITVNSVYMEGSTFVIEIPQKVLSSEVLKNVNNRLHASEKRRSYHRSFEAPEARILAVDDTEANLLVVGKLLRDTKIKLDTASSGREALKMTQDQYYHLILMDHLMPGMDGIECFHEIRNQTGGMNRETAVVALTANAGRENAELYAKEGFDGYLVKPVTGEELESEVRRLLPKDLVTVSEDEMEITEESLQWIAQRDKKAKVTVSTESVADIPKWMLEKNHISVIPHMVKTNAGVFRDGLELDQEGVLAYMEKKSPYIRALAPSVSEMEAFFARQLSGANHVIHISLSSKLEDSGCVAAKEAARSFDNIHVIDSENLSTGQGLMVLQACRMAKEGKSADQIVLELEELKNRVHTSFIVDSLDYLAQTQQIGEQTAGLANAFMIHPVLVMKKGKLKVGRVFFGNRQRTWARYISAVLDTARRIDKSMLFITYVGLTQNDLDKIKAEVEKHTSFERIYFQKASPAIAVNSGPGTFGLLFLYA